MKNEYIAVGIDLGTTNTVLAIFDKATNEPRVIETRDGQPQMPSVVGVLRARAKKNAPAKPPEIVVGAAAQKNMAVAPPEDTIYSVKRLMGRSFDDPNVADVRARVGYRIVAPKDGTNASVNVVLDDRASPSDERPIERSPVEISEMILRKIKEDAEYSLPGNPKITHAVITVPTYFNSDQKKATRAAGVRAGFQVMRILDEPIAAAYYYKLPIDDMEAKGILVFDFGGGTFDISILSGQAGQFMVMARGGDMWLGGDDLDQALETALVDQTLDPAGEYGVDLRGNRAAMMRLRREVRGAKESLVSQPTVEISLGDEAKDGAGQPIRLDVSRLMLERVIAPLVYSFRVCRSSRRNDKTGQPFHSDAEAGMIDVALPRSQTKEPVHWSRLYLPTEQTCVVCGGSLADAPVREGKTRALVNATLAEKNMKRAFVDYVIMAGNSTREPLVQRAMEEDFGAPKILRVSNPKHCVALGAAKVAASMSHLVCDLGHVNEFGAAKCGECSAALGPASALPKPPPVTSSFHYGVVWPGRPFEAFVAKGSVCPTKDVKERPFPTRVTNQRMMTLSIHARDQVDKPTYDESQYKGLVVLPRGLPGNTQVKLKLWLDGNGTLGLSAQLKDGAPLKPFRLEGGAESKLVESLEALGEKMGSLLVLLRDKLKELRADIDDAYDLAFSDKFEEAAARVAKIDERLDRLKRGEVEGDPAEFARQMAGSFITFVQKVVRGRLGFLFPEETTAMFVQIAGGLVADFNAGRLPSPEVLKMLPRLLALIPPGVRRLVHAEIAIEVMRDERPHDAQNYNDELGVALGRLRRGEPSAEEEVDQVVAKIVDDSAQAAAGTTCPEAHPVLVRFCSDPAHRWDSWGAAAA
jgi:molecular chaperone DnaK (HSP70)